MSGSDPMRRLTELFAQSPAFPGVRSAIAEGGNLYVSGLWGASQALFLACCARRSAGVTLVVASDIDAAADLHADLSVFHSGDVALFPQWEILPGEDEALASDDIARERLIVADALAAGRLGRGAVVVASIQSLVQGAPDPVAFSRNARHVAAGASDGLEALVAWLADADYEREDVVESPGAFAVRGGLVDVFPANSDRPYRVEFLGDDVDSIRAFDHETQESLDRTDAFVVLRRDAGRTASPSATVPLGTLLPAGSTVAFVEALSIAEHGKRYLDTALDPAGLYRPESVLAAEAPEGGANVFLSTFRESFDPDRSFDFETAALDDFPAEPARAVDDLVTRAQEGSPLFLFANNPAEEARLDEMLAERGSRRLPALVCAIGRVSCGFASRDPSFAVVAHHEIFHRYRRRYAPRAPVPARPIDSFLDLSAGDVVVHTTKGIAVYEGLRVIEGTRGAEEFLCLRFAGKAKLFVPTGQIDLVNKYVGGRERKPTLSKLTGRSWTRRKEAVAEATMGLAAELLEIQAAREVIPGIAFAPDGDWQKEFDAAFLYEETPDQSSALGDIKGDMVAKRPMDRLVCGDVGYGKTELAMRAAFKAAASGKQVAVLAPTTLLVEQHFRTFTERMRDFPVEIRALDRFRTPAEEREILAGLAGGKVDVVIGTHRLLQKDVRFFDLGLLVIDEEQRFGVRHKEMLKRFTTMVDCLTLTATPIPRTLHMALLGLRDISNLMTAPQDRMAIETIVCRFDAARVRTAILRELARNGQVYFVHNRVHSIRGVAERLRAIVPEARFAVGHGQMPERELEEQMMTFLNRDADVLVATTIIENGLDIPTVNTIFIDRADRFGLADLHQLRGRVGRYRHRAYAYMLLPEGRPVTPVAARRLRAIADHSELGAGFKIAMRDLEIRGAGNLLGPEQSGHIAAVGYDLYCRLLERNVHTLRHDKAAPEAACTIDVAVTALLSETYIPSDRVRMEAYRQLVCARDRDDLAAIAVSWRDRFGAPPAEAVRLVAKHAVRLAAAGAGVRSVTRSENMLVCLAARPPEAAERINAAGVVARVVDDRTFVLPLPPDAAADDDRLLAFAARALASATSTG